MDERLCKYCCLPMPQKPGELPSKYRSRRYHDIACAAADRRRNENVKRPVALPKSHPDPMSGFFLLLLWLRCGMVLNIGYR